MMLTRAPLQKKRRGLEPLAAVRVCEPISGSRPKALEWRIVPIPLGTHRCLGFKSVKQRWVEGGAKLWVTTKPHMCTSGALEAIERAAEQEPRYMIDR